MLTVATALSTSKAPQFSDYAVDVLPDTAAAPKLSQKTDAYPDSDPRIRQALELRSSTARTSLDITWSLRGRAAGGAATSS